MAETKPTATVKATSVQPKKSSNAISWIAPIVCIIAGYLHLAFYSWEIPDGFEDTRRRHVLAKAQADLKMRFTEFMKAVSLYLC